MSFWIGLLVGLWIGCAIGVILAGLMAAGRVAEAEERAAFEIERAKRRREKP